MIENPEDYQRAALLGPRLLGSIMELLSGGDATGDDTRILKTIFSNMVKILVYDHELRGIWLYNAWRMKIATGHFATLVALMTSATVIGTSLFPGAGTIVGLCFGFAGGALALFIIPEHIQDSITNGIIQTRMAINQGRAGTIREELRSLDRNMKNPIFDSNTKSLNVSYTKKTTALLQKARAYRENAMTAQFEGLFRIYSHIKTLQGNHKVATTSGNEQAIVEINKKIETLTEAFNQNLKEASKFYGRQIQLFDQLRLKPSIKEVADLISGERTQLQQLSSAMDTIVAGLLQGDDDAASAYWKQMFLTKVYILGFNESGLSNPSTGSAITERD